MKLSNHAQRSSPPDVAHFYQVALTITLDSVRLDTALADKGTGINHAKM